MVESVSSLFSPQQITLTAVIVVACAGLAWTRQGGSTDFEELHERRWRLTVGAVVAAVAVFLFLRCGNPIGIRVDSWSDANVVVSGRNYARMGLFSNYGAAQHQVVSEHHPNDPFYIYTNYPVLPNLISGLWHSAGVTSVRAHRLLPAACSILAILVWLAIFRRFCDDSVAALAAIVMATSYAFLAYADNLHFHAYAHLSSALALLFFIRAAHADARHRNRDLRFSAVAVFVTALLTWEYHLYLVLFILLYPRLFPSGLRLPGRLLILAPIGAALALQILQRRAVMIDDTGGSSADGQVWFLRSIYLRTIGFGLGDSPEGVNLLNYPAVVLRQFFDVYGIPLLGLMAALAGMTKSSLTAPVANPPSADSSEAQGVSARTRGAVLSSQSVLQGLTPPLRLAILLAVSGAGWSMVMLQHTCVHPHVMRQGLAAYSLLSAAACMFCWRTARAAAQGPPRRIAAAMLGLSMAYAQAEGALCSVQQHWTQDSRDRRDRDDSGQEEVRVLSAFAPVFPRDAVIFSGYSRLPPIRYWLDRPAYLSTPGTVPANDPRGRLRLELNYHHVRELYAWRMPRVYYLYPLRSGDEMKCFEEDPYLRAFLMGNSRHQSEEREKAARIFSELRAGRLSAESFCPILGRVGAVICFRIDPLLPELAGQFGDLRPPTRAEFARPPKTDLMHEPSTMKPIGLCDLPPPPPPRPRARSGGLGTGRMKLLDHWVGLPLCFALSFLARFTRRLLPERPHDLQDGQTIAVLKFFGLGSIMQAAPLLRAIRQTYPRSRLVFVTFRGNQGLIQRLELCTDVRAIRTTSLLRFAMDTVRELAWLRRSRVRAVIDLEFFSKFSTLLSYFSGAPIRVAFHLNDFWRYSLITHPIYFNYFKHVSDLYRHAASRIQVKLVDHRLAPLHVPEASLVSAKEFLRQSGWSPGQRLLGVNINAGDVSLERRWPLERFAAVILYLLRTHDDWRVVLTGSAGEKAYVLSLSELIPVDLRGRLIGTAGVWSLDEFIAGLGLMDGFLTNDSGPMHIAAAQCVPLVSLWGPGRPAFYSPASDRHIEIYEHYPCSPCLYMFTTFEGMWCGHEGWCMSAIEPAVVIAAVEKMMSLPSSPARPEAGATVS